MRRCLEALISDHENSDDHGDFYSSLPYTSICMHILDNYLSLSSKREDMVEERQMKGKG
ncbi:hypothetical protein EYM_01925 [Ignicoccus islandicus DSM 13165]|uniref:Uncharacterized protein n=1 Tax=Ignicoccus islandicus DSM 13165 TaxID=940295 RepID=A0A0U3DXP0_9CREN|nr:hypothetical protein [Ignicoccus islandicus]ALU12266.1 hypothetical protein EYM_01925 [Ignicoccus islandicus DSM 13165]